MTPRWAPAETEPGNRAFTTDLGSVDVLVTFTGRPPTELTGEWTATDAADGTVLLSGTEPALVGQPSAVQVYASLVSVAEVLSARFAPPEVPSGVMPSSEVPSGVEHRVIRLAASDSAAAFAEDTAALLDEQAAAGWRLVSVDNLWAYFERHRASGPPR